MTELEGAVLGVVWSRGPLTGYAVRQRFQRSPTVGWSASEGAIYPAIERLIGYGFIRSVEEMTGRRSGRALTVTAEGEEALRFWISSLADSMGGAPVDPIRTRVNYLGALPPVERRAFLDSAERNARAALAAIRGHDIDPKHKDPWALKASLLGAAMDVEARLKWIDEVRRLLPGG